MASINAASKMCFADQEAGGSRTVTSWCCTTVLTTDEREWHPIIEECLFSASSCSALAMGRAVSLLGIFGILTKFERSSTIGCAGILTSVVLAIDRIDLNSSYGFADMLLITARGPAPLGLRVGRSRSTIGAMAVVVVLVVMMMVMSRGGHEEVDQVVRRHFGRVESVRLWEKEAW